MVTSETSVAVIVASLGRPDALSDLLAALRLQTRLPNRILISVTSPADLPPDMASYPEVETIFSHKGSCVQRNAALDRLDSESAIVLFIDDDYLPSRFAIERLARFFDRNPDVAGASGHLIADGAQGPEVGLAEAQAMLSAYDAAPVPPLVVHRDLYGLYGCNMAFRTSRVAGIRFDERLPLYGWQEDIDFSAQVRTRGRIVKTFAFAGVHRGVKGGRSAGIRLGYSQVVNPVYLARKGTMRAHYAARIVARNVLSNHVRAFRPEPWIDRLGRVRGNWLGLVDLALGRVRPEHVVNL